MHEYSFDIRKDAIEANTEIMMREGPAMLGWGYDKALAPEQPGAFCRDTMRDRLLNELIISGQITLRASNWPKVIHYERE